MIIRYVGNYYPNDIFHILLAFGLAAGIPSHTDLTVTVF